MFGNTANINTPSSISEKFPVSEKLRSRFTSDPVRNLTVQLEEAKNGKSTILFVERVK